MIAHEDERGTIEDLIGHVDAVTRITTVEGAVRGNHVHHFTTQWTLVLTGCLLICEGTQHGRSMRYLRPGELYEHGPGVAHAWRAMENTECLVFTRGPRAGEDYESDTHRLEQPLLSGPGLPRVPG